MDEALIRQILARPRWSDKKLEEAARGKAIGSCADTPDIELQFWVELARGEAERNGISPEPAIEQLVRQALQGNFG